MCKIWINFFLINVNFRLVEKSGKSKSPKPPSLTFLFTTSRLILSILHPHRKLKINLSKFFIIEQEGLINGIAKYENCENIRD